MRQIITSGLWLDSTSLLAHSPEREIHQALAVDVGINGLAELRRCNGIESGLLGFTQWPDFLHLIQILLDHVLDCDTLSVRSLNRAWLIQFGLTSPHPGLSSLFSGEGLALLVDLRSIAEQAYLCRVAD